jgi:hypothetical protein
LSDEHEPQAGHRHRDVLAGVASPPGHGLTTSIGLPAAKALIAVERAPLR